MPCYPVGQCTSRLDLVADWLRVEWEGMRDSKGTICQVHLTAPRMPVDHMLMSPGPSFGVGQSSNGLWSGDMRWRRRWKEQRQI